MRISEINYDLQFEPIFSNFTFKGIEILSKSGNQFNSSQFNRYFRAQALIGLGRIDEAKSTLNYLRYMPYINFDAAFVKYRAAKLYESM